MYALFKCHIFITPCIRTHTSPPGRCSPETYAYFPKTQSSVRQGHSHVAEAMQFQPGVFANPALGKNTTDPHGFIKQPIQYTSYSTLQNPQSALYSLHSTLCTPRFIPHTPCTLRPPHTTVHTLPSTHYTQDPTLKTQDSTLYSLHCTLSTLVTLHTAPYTPHSRFRTPRSTF